MTAVHMLIEEAELAGRRVVPVDRLREAVTQDTTARRETARADTAAIAAAVAKHRPRCDLHNMPDCSPLLNGCTRVNAMIEERDRIVDLITGSESLSA